MKLRSKIKMMCVAIGSLGMLLIMPITLSLADTPIDHPKPHLTKKNTLQPLQRENIARIYCTYSSQISG
jgi:hypothetical protein